MCGVGDVEWVVPGSGRLNPSIFRIDICDVVLSCVPFSWSRA
jgi:hypothetical protein